MVSLFWNSLAMAECVRFVVERYLPFLRGVEGDIEAPLQRDSAQTAMEIRTQKGNHAEAQISEHRVSPGIGVLIEIPIGIEVSD